VSLTETTEQMNETLRRAESVLESLKLGVSASVPLCRQSGQVLRFCKDGNEWRLMVSAGSGQERSDCPVLSASRAIRLAALESLQLLHRALLDQHASQDAAISARVTAANTFLDQLESTAPKQDIDF
jgi:hypothetical protein